LLSTVVSLLSRVSNPGPFFSSDEELKKSPCNSLIHSLIHIIRSFFWPRLFYGYGRTFDKQKRLCREQVGLRRGSVDGGSSELLTRLALFNNEIQIEKFFNTGTPLRD